MSPLRANPALVCGYHALQMALLPMAIWTIYLQRHLGFSMLEIMVAQATFGASMALCEFPSGYLADRLGYRKSLIAAAVLSILAWSAFTLATSFTGVLVAEALLGASISLISGCLSALMYESLLQLDSEPEFARWTGRMRFFGQASEGTAALFAGFLFALNPRLPFALEIGFWVIAIGVAWRMVEPPRDSPPIRDHLSHIKGMLRHVLQDHRLSAVFALGIALGLCSFLPVWIVSIYASEAGLPDAWLGPLWAVANYSVALAALASDGFARHFGLLRALSICIVLVLVGYLGMGLSHALWGFAFYYAFTVVRGLQGPALHHAEQRLIPSADRAGFTSLRSLLFQLGFLVLGPATGLVMDRWGAHVGLLCVGAILVPAATFALLRVRATSASDPMDRP